MSSRIASRKRWAAGLSALMLAAGVLAVGGVSAVGAQADYSFRITDLSVVSSSARNVGIYGLGESILIEATFNRAVVVHEGSGVPAINVQVGGGRSHAWRMAEYRYRSADDKLVFGYMVTAADRDSDGIHSHGGWQDDSGTWHNSRNFSNLTDRYGFAASRQFSGLATQPGHKVDGSLIPYGTSRVTSSPQGGGDTYLYGDVLEFDVTFKAPIAVEGTLLVSMRVGSDDPNVGYRAARYVSGSGTETLTFRYEIQQKDADTDGVEILGSWDLDGTVHGLGGGGTTSVAGLGVETPVWFEGVRPSSSNKVNGARTETSPPRLRSADFTSMPDDGVYGIGDKIQLTFSYNEPVSVVGTPTVVIEVQNWNQFGSKHYKNATYARHSGHDIVLEYEVQAGDVDPDGIKVLSDGYYMSQPGYPKVTYSSANKVTDAHGNSATFTLGEVLWGNDNHRVEGVPPTVLSVQIESDAGNDNTYRLDDEIVVKVSFSEAMAISGMPQLALQIGDNTRQATFDTYTAVSESVHCWLCHAEEVRWEALFSYTVQMGDTDTDGVSVEANALSLNGGSMTDAVGNDLVLTHSAVPASDLHTVSAPGGA